MLSPRYFMQIAVLLAAVSTLAFQQPKGRSTDKPPAVTQQGKTSAAPPVNQRDNPPKQPTAPRPTETFWQKTLRILGISVTPSALKGDDDSLIGDVWLVDLQTKSPLRLTRVGGYRSPLVLSDEQTALALKGETIYEIPLDGGAAKDRFTIKGIVKLAAVEVETRKHVLLLREDEARQMVVELLSLADGKRTAWPYDPASKEDKQMLAYLRSWERSYDSGRFTLYTQSESKTAPDDSRIEWHDVYLKKAGLEPVNLSRCEPVNCGQPALSPNARYVVYIKAR